jgi:hypothetical protein
VPLLAREVAATSRPSSHWPSYTWISVACSSLVALAGDGEVGWRRAIGDANLLLALEPAVEEGTGEEWKSLLPRAREGRDGEV